MIKLLFKKAARSVKQNSRRQSPFGDARKEAAAPPNH